MTANSKCSLTCENPVCPVVALLHAILEEVKALRQTSKNTKKTSKTTASRLHVGRLVMALQLEYPEKVWTSDSFAEAIGCTGAAVRKTRAWGEYKKRLEGEKRKHQPHKGFKDKRGNLDAYATNNEDECDG